MRRLIAGIGLSIVLTVNSGWGFFAHQKINRLAVFTLPTEMIGFYKKNIQFIQDAAVDPDKRRYIVAEEACRHFIDMDRYGDSLATLPHGWEAAVKKYGADSLMAHGIVVWHLQRMVYRLQESFMMGDPHRILKVSAELGHYAGDASVPLHTTSNYNGQKTGQAGIHAFWESRLPELFITNYEFFVGRAEYIPDVREHIWRSALAAHAAVDSVLAFEKNIFAHSGEQKFSFETKGKQTVKVISESYARQYHDMLTGMVERQMRLSIKLTGDLWFTAWINAGQPDLRKFLTYVPSETELTLRREELNALKQNNYHVREHE